MNWDVGEVSPPAPTSWGAPLSAGDSPATPPFDPAASRADSWCPPVRARSEADSFPMLRAPASCRLAPDCCIRASRHQLRGDRLHAPKRRLTRLRAARAPPSGPRSVGPIRHKPAAWIPCSPSPGRPCRQGTLFRSALRSPALPPFPTVSLHAAAWGKPPPRSCQGQVRPPRRPRSGPRCPPFRAHPFPGLPWRGPSR
jgi:hypothetical protein